MNWNKQNPAEPKMKNAQLSQSQNKWQGKLQVI